MIKTTYVAFLVSIFVCVIAACGDRSGNRSRVAPGVTGAALEPLGGYPAGSCSESRLRTGPPAGKGIFAADPIDKRFPFQSHWVGEWIAGTEPKFIGMQMMGDFDGDGDLDFAAGQRHTLPGGMVWWEHCTADHWVAHLVGTGHKAYSGGDSMDVDGDGLMDIVAGDSWYKNPGKSRDMQWERFNAGTPPAEEVTIGDITGDGRHEVLYVLYNLAPQWWSPGDDPKRGFKKGAELAHPINQGGSWGDLNGDGANDYLVGPDYWFENIGGGASFTEHHIVEGADFDFQPLTYIGDLDNDGDNDYAISTHWLGKGDVSRLAWVENLDGKGTRWQRHLLNQTKKFTHGVILADFDNDNDLDIFWAQNVGPSFIFENVDGKGRFIEHKIVEDFRGHTPRAGDADCDGDLDLIGSPWGDRDQYSSGESVWRPFRDVVYLENLTVDRGGAPIFDAARQPYELGARDEPHCGR